MTSRRVENTVCLSISVARLRELLSNGDLRVCDFHCLDRRSKKTVWLLLLQSLPCF